jgi:hypothetical protein
MIADTVDESWEGGMVEWYQSNIKKHYDILREIHEGQGEGVRNGCDTNVSH